MSFGLTQYDVEELIEHCGGKCRSLPSLFSSCANLICKSGKYVAERLPAPLLLAVSQDEIETLYRRFRTLDRGRKVWPPFCSGSCVPVEHCHARLGAARRRANKASFHAVPILRPVPCPGVQGYISAQELLNIPELSINPLAKRLERMLDNINFKAGGSDFRTAAHVIGL
jgi:hypothetical protein